MKAGQIVKINSERPAAARFNGMKAEVVRDVVDGDPAFNEKVSGQEQVVVLMEGAEIYFFASELEDSEVAAGERQPGDRRIDQQSGDLSKRTVTGTGAPPVGELPRRPDGSFPNEVPAQTLQPEPTAPNPETGKVGGGAPAARSSEDNPPPDGMPRHAPVRPGFVERDTPPTQDQPPRKRG